MVKRTANIQTKVVHAWLCPGAIVGGLMALAAATWAGGFDPGGRVRGVMIPVFVGTNKQPSATLRLREIRQESRRVGFFRIGIMPICLGEGAQVHLRTNQDSLAVLSRINGLLKPFAEHRALELRRLEVFRPSEKTPCLSADRVCCEANGQWRLTDGLTLRVGGETLRAKAGDFHVAGLLAGHVVLVADQGSRTIQVLGTAQETHSQ